MLLLWARWQVWVLWLVGLQVLLQQSGVGWLVVWPPVQQAHCTACTATTLQQRGGVWPLLAEGSSKELLPQLLFRVQAALWALCWLLPQAQARLF
jgi:hypothetical protein